MRTVSIWRAVLKQHATMCRQADHDSPPCIHCHIHITGSGSRGQRFFRPAHARHRGSIRKAKGRNATVEFYASRQTEMDAGAAMSCSPSTPARRSRWRRRVARSERWVEVAGPHGTVREWSVLPTKPDNHWLDCLVGCAVAASMLGVRVPGQDAKPVRQRKRYTQADLRRP